MNFTDFVREISIEYFGKEYQNDPNLIGTPTRVEGVFDELLYGHSGEAMTEMTHHLRKTFPTEYRGLVVIQGIESVGMCPHHFLPVLYEIDFGYVPREESLGLSKIPRVIKILSSRAVLQEDLTREIADVFETSLNPLGLAVVLRGFHTCMAIRGVKEREAKTTTAEMRGLFAENNSEIKQEFLGYLKR